MNVVSVTQLYRCCLCRMWWPRTPQYFERNKDKLCGVGYRCRVCQRRSSRKRRKENLDYHRNYLKQWNEANPQYRKDYREANHDRIKKNERAWREKNKEKRNAKRRKVRDKPNRPRGSPKELAPRKKRESPSREELNARQRELYKKQAATAEGREKARIRSRNRYALQRNAMGSHSENEVLAMYDDQGGLCAYCEIPLFGNYEVDHMIPITRGGCNDWSNLAITCPFCNRSKQAKTAEEFMETIM